jgi:hypothetical protein
VPARANRLSLKGRTLQAWFVPPINSHQGPVLAFALDVIYQFIEWHGLKALQALLTAIVLAVIPYALLRGPRQPTRAYRPDSKTKGLTGS